MPAYPFLACLASRQSRARDVSALNESQVFNATNSTISLPDTNTTEFLKQQCPNVEHWREMGADEAPLSNRKIREVLGFKEEHNWKMYTPLDK